MDHLKPPSLDVTSYLVLAPEPMLSDYANMSHGQEPVA